MRKLLFVALSCSALSCGSEKEDRPTVVYPQSSYYLLDSNSIAFSPCHPRITTFVEDYGPCNRFSPLRLAL